MRTRLIIEISHDRKPTKQQLVDYVRVVMQGLGGKLDVEDPLSDVFGNVEVIFMAVDGNIGKPPQVTE